MFARIANPPFDRSAVDGYGIGKDDIHRPAPYALRMIGKISAGDAPSTMQISGGTTVRLRRARQSRRVLRVSSWRNTVHPMAAQPRSFEERLLRKTSGDAARMFHPAASSRSVVQRWMLVT
jgi:molybdopterin biosynthesis enzyme